MSIWPPRSPMTAAIEKARGGGKKEYDWWLLTVLPAVIAIAVVFGLMAFFLTPVAKENKSRLEEQSRQNRIQAVEEYENDREEGGVAAGVHEAVVPGR